MNVLIILWGFTMVDGIRYKTEIAYFDNMQECVQEADNLKAFDEASLWAFECGKEQIR